MTTLIFKKVIKEAENRIKRLAKRNGWLWFYKMHQKEVIESVQELLKVYPRADKKVVLVSCWLHDIAHYYAKNGREISKVKKNHHIESAKIAEQILVKYGINQEEIDAIKNCILRHRNLKFYQPRTLEEKIVVVADSLSHFRSIFYLTYFKFHPAHSLEQMVKTDLVKLARDWRDLGLLPEAKDIAKGQYKVLRKLLENYKKITVT